MNKITLLLVLAFCATTLSAQETKFGITAGYLNAEAKISVDGEGSVSASESGFYAGFLADIELSESLHLQPEALYGRIDDASVVYIPVLLKYYIADSGFNFLVGPQGTIDLEESSPDYSNFGIDATFGVGYDITSNFFIEARYSLEVTNRINVPQEVSYDISGKINSLHIGLGYKFN